MPYPSRPLHERLYSRLALDEKTGCWLWTGGVFNHGGYGQISGGKLDGHYFGKNLQTHRLAYELWVGGIPKRALVLHKCDTPRCCNPAHLFLGTPQENMTDKVSKGRQARGEAINRGVLDSARVREIKARYAAGERNKSALARDYGVSNVLIGLIIRGKAWRHVH